MTDVFLSYSSKDRGGKNEDGSVRVDRIGPIVELLEEQGFEVFWDQKVPPGTDWDEWIRQKLKDASCAIALWSENSIKSKPVRQEATIAHKAGKLISVLIDKLDPEDLPMGLYGEQAAMLVGWTKEDGDERWQSVFSQVEARLAPHAPLWFQHAIHRLEADLSGEKEKVKTAQSQTKEIQKNIAKSAQQVLGAERDRDAAVEEAAALKTQLKDAADAHSALETRLAQAKENLRTAEAAQGELSAKLKDAEAALEPSKDATRELESLKQKLAGTERELEEARRQLKERKPWPTTRGGTLYVLLAGVIAFISFLSLSEIAGGAGLVESLKPLLSLGLPVEVGVTGAGIAFLLSVIMLLIRRRQLGALELAFYWFALVAPLGVLLAAVIGSWLASSYASDAAYPYFVGFLVGWFLLAASAWFFSARRGPGLTVPAIAVYWLGICLPWFWLPVANYFYSGVLGLTPFYIRPVSGEDYSGYVIALVLVAASGLFVARRWPRRSPGAVSEGSDTGSLRIGAFWLLGMIASTMALTFFFSNLAWDWVGAPYYPKLGGFATGVLIALLIALGSVFALYRNRAPLDDGEARIYWLGCAALVVLFISCWFGAKEIDWFGMTDPATGGLWSGALFALAGTGIVFAVRRYRNR